MMQLETPMSFQRADHARVHKAQSGHTRENEPCHDRHHHRGHAAHETGSLNKTAFMATVHCLTGCTIGEVVGMALGTAMGWGNWLTVSLAVALAFLFDSHGGQGGSDRESSHDRHH